MVNFPHKIVMALIKIMMNIDAMLKVKMEVLQYFRYLKYNYYANNKWLFYEKKVENVFL